ncbi:MBL fold metallo-hydrolase [bacterium]|nr:MBL fold metallo-hydrolase [bacterium]
MTDLPCQLVRADNPGAFTGTGTNTYILGEDEVVVVDPGPALPAHLQAITAALGGRRLRAILVTHAHLDHSALAPLLAARTGAEVLAFGGALSGISPAMHALAAEGLEGGEGSDTGFAPDTEIADGQILTLAGLRIEVIHTPGHMGSHVALALGDVLLSGDHVMGWSTSIVSPPEGDMGAYMRSLHKLSGRGWRRFLPGHGPAIEAPAARLAELIAHREAREAAVLAALTQTGPASAADLARRIYTTTPPGLLPAATRNVLAHLIDLQDRALVRAGPGRLVTARFARI